MSEQSNNSSIPAGFKLRHKLAGSLSGVHQLAWAPNGKTLAALSKGGSLQFWNAETGELAHTVEGHSKKTLAISWSPNGNALAMGVENLIVLLDMTSYQLYRSFKKSFSQITELSWGPDQRTLAVGYADGSIQFWDSSRGSINWDLSHQHFGHSQARSHIDSVSKLVWSTDGQYLVSSSNDRSIKLWRPEEKHLVQSLTGDSGINSIALAPDGKTLVSASSARTIRLWNLEAGRDISVIEGHTDLVKDLSYSSDGKLLASVSNDDTVRFWRCKDWKMVASIPAEQVDKAPAHGVAFHPSKPLVATLGERDLAIYIWDLDLNTVLTTASMEESVHYTTAKIALVGDSGVGKTGIGWRLAHGTFKEHASTHGQQFWVIDALSEIRSDGTQCEAVLWDFAGQPDYRLLHTLFLDDVDLALILFDPTHRLDPLKGVEFWLRQFSNRQGNPPHIILVGARIDRGSPVLTTDELEGFCTTHQVTGGCVLTSAVSGEGVHELMRRVKNGIAWEEMTATITTSTFKRIKEYILDLKEDTERKGVLVSPIQLRERLTMMDLEWQFTDEEMMTAVKLLANHGYVTVLRGSSGEETVLLAPDLLTNLASSFLLEARRNPKGLGVLDEARVLSGDYPFPELLGLDEKEQEILLDAASILFLEHNVCFRETLTTQTFLIFPSLINQKRPLLEDVETVEGHSYVVTGAVDNVYAALVVLLGYTNTFTRTNQWQNQAEYEMSRSEVCGFRQSQEHEGEIDLVLYFGKAVAGHARLLFQGLFEKFLMTRDVVVTKYPPVLCPECGYLQERTVIIKRIRTGKEFIHCDECGEKIELPTVGAEVNLSRRDRAKLEQERILAKLRTIFEAGLVRIKGFIRDAPAYQVSPPTCFISYAWGDSKHEKWVLRLANDLKNAAISVLLDQLDNATPGSNISRFISHIEKSDYIIVVGTPSYLQKYENNVSSMGSIVAAEVDLIQQRLLGTEEMKRTVIPIILQGDEWKSLPPLLRGRVFIESRYEESYFANMFDLILTLYRIPYSNPAFKEIRESLRADIGILKGTEEKIAE